MYLKHFLFWCSNDQFFTLITKNKNNGNKRNQCLVKWKICINLHIYKVGNIVPICKYWCFIICHILLSKIAEKESDSENAADQLTFPLLLTKGQTALPDVLLSLGTLTAVAWSGLHYRVGLISSSYDNR